MAGKRTRYSAEFKALEALRGELAAVQLAAKHGINQTMVGEWRRQATEGLAAVFSAKSAASEAAKAVEADVEKLHAKIGQLVVERDFWRKPSVDACRTQASDGRTCASAAVHRAAVRVGVNQPLWVLPPTSG
jgi:transposase